MTNTAERFEASLRIYNAASHALIEHGVPLSLVDEVAQILERETFIQNYQRTEQEQEVINQVLDN